MRRRGGVRCERDGQKGDGYLVGHDVKGLTLRDLDHDEPCPGALVARLSCTLVDRHGVIHAGELVPGENLVAATFELTVQRLDASAS